MEIIKHNDRSNPAISIIVPCYNVGSYIAPTLDSILHQNTRDVDRGIEVIAVDDASDDHTHKILNNFARHCPRTMKVVHNGHNKGVAESRNIGVAASSGDTVMFVDGDDRIGVGGPSAPSQTDEHYLSAFYDAIRADSSSSMVVGNHIQRREGAPEANFNKKLSREFAEPKQMGGAEALAFLNRKVSCWGILYRADMLRGAVSFNPGMKYYEDADFVMRYAMSARGRYPYILSTVKHDSYYGYFQRPNSEMTKLGDHSEREMRRILRTKNALTYFSYLMISSFSFLGADEPVCNRFARKYAHVADAMDKYADEDGNYDIYSVFQDYVPRCCRDCAKEICSGCCRYDQLMGAASRALDRFVRPANQR